jgi:hypothetical protein
VEEKDWARLIAQLSQGDCTPFLGAGACATLPSGAVLSSEWAERYSYPFVDSEDLARVMQYAAIAEGDTVFLKEKICTYFSSVAAPDFSDPAEPHALLANFPIKVFITTNYDNFLVRALRLRGKKPNAEICSWFAGAKNNRDFFASEAGLVPDPKEPLIYHLHGSIGTPKSLVLTENDYLEFLVKISTSRYDEDRQIIPTTILSALTDNPLLFIGYSLRDWSFRVLFHSLLSSIIGINRRRHVSVQLLPSLKYSGKEAEARARSYLTRYLEDWRISIFWGTATEFCGELRQRIDERS